MKLINRKLGEFIFQKDQRNNELKYSIESVCGVNNLKELMPTRADLNGRDISKFLIVEPGDFVYNHRTSRHGGKFCIAYNNGEKPIICTEDYTVFSIKNEAKEELLAQWLFIYFRRPECDRFVMYSSWGSSTEFFGWDEICDINIKLPPLHIQQKYVDIYNAMIANQQSYERGLDDLKLTCDAYIEELRKKTTSEPIGQYISRHDVRNGINGTKNVMGISTSKEFREPTSKVNKNELSNYKVVKPRQIGFVQTTHNEKVFTYAFNNTDKDIVISSVNEVFSCDEGKLLPEYLSMFFNRTEFDRYARFHSWGSARETFTWIDLIEVKIPIPEIKIQQSIADIYTAYKKRKYINEQLKEQIKDICPILIKGSLEECTE